MSYEILYNKQFIKTIEGKFIPIILNGSNNCYSVSWSGRERRERNWSICNMPQWCNYKMDFTAEELLKEQDRWLDNNEMFMYNNKWMTGKQWISFVKKAIKEAKTIEELNSYEKPTVLFSIWENLDNRIENKKVINNSQDLQIFIEEYNNRVEHRIESEKVYPCINFPCETFNHQKTNKTKTPKERLTDFYVVIVDKGYAQYFVSQLTARRLKYSQSTNNAKQFKTEQDALKWINDKSINTKFNVTCLVQKAV
jgi:hypothetical protein